MEYRNDLEAARLRINTLEAKLEESNAALEAREAELAECRAELDRLRRLKQEKAQATPQSSPSSKGFMIMFGLATLVIASLLTVLVGRKPVQPEPQPIVTPPESTSGAEGKIHLPPPVPEVPKAHVEGHISPPVPDPLASATIVEGQTDPNGSEVKSIDAIVQEARPLARECYKKEAEKHPDRSGSVTVLFDIDAAGKVMFVEVKEMLQSRSPWWSKDFESCLIGVYKKLKFPATNSPKTRAKGTYFFSALDRML